MMEPRLAATVLLAREGRNGAPELFLVRRHGGNAFMPGAHVFVGGKLDPADRSLEVAGRCRHLGAPEAAGRLGVDEPATALGLYVAALRETFEESGVLIAEDAAGAPVRPARLAALRAALEADGSDLVALLEAERLWLDPSRLRYLCRWVTPTFQSIRFDAFFFVCRAPEGQRPHHDRYETTDGGWFTVAELLERNRAEALHLPPPTLCTLESLQRARSVDDLLAAAGDAPQAPQMPKLVGEPGPGMRMLLPGDHRYNGHGSGGDSRGNGEPGGRGREHYVVLKGRHWEIVDRRIS